MTRSIQHRDISDPIEQIVRDHLTSLDIPAIYWRPLMSALITEVNGLVQRAMDEGYEAGLTDADR